MNLTASPLINKGKKNKKNKVRPTVIPLYSSACPAQLPSPFCCFAACVDVYGTHSNVHLRCFHTGKSTAIRAAPSPWKLPVSSSVIIISVICVFISSIWCHSKFADRRLPVQCHFICTARVWGHLFSDDISVFILIVIQISFVWQICSACTQWLFLGLRSLDWNWKVFKCCASITL